MKILRDAQQLLPILLVHYLPDSQFHERLLSFGEKVIKSMILRAQHRGERDLISYVKQTRNIFTRWLSKSPVTEGGGVKIQHGFPVWLEECKSWLRTRSGKPRLWVIRWVLTLLTITRALRLSPEVDLDPITKPCTGDPLGGLSFREVRQSLVEMFSTWILEGKDLRKRPSGIPKISTRWDHFHLTTKSGPNGHCMWNAVEDSQSLTLTQIQDLQILGGKPLVDKINALQTAVVKPKGPDGGEGTPFLEVYRKIGSLHPYKGVRGSLRKLCGLPDSEGKTRTVAIFDYYSQSGLKKLHDELMRLLRGLPQDCTFNQESFVTKLHRLDGHLCHSLDLSNATDRLPIELQSQVLTLLVGKKKTAAWRRLLVGSPFRLDGRNDIQYMVGQPMGAYSSWPMMALTHHVIVWCAARRAGVKPDSLYCILGDDIVITHDTIAFEYQKIMECLGVTISPLKTHHSAELMEFAKRWILNGEEVTPFSLSGLLETRTSYPLLSAFLHQQSTHSWSVKCGTGPLSLMKTILWKAGKPLAWANRLSKLGMVFWQILESRRRKRFDGSVKRTINDLFGPLSAKAEEADEEKLLERFRLLNYQEILSQLDTIANEDAVRTQTAMAREWPGLDEKSYEALIMELDPISSFLAREWDKKCVEMTMYRFADPDQIDDEVKRMGETLAPLFIVKSIFTMREHNQRILAQARMVKQLIHELV
uniref:RNA-dependent RNA polymerase n=1 Tax=Obscuromonas mitovirus 1 TaxID=3157912 RepID=A0AAU7BNU1_9VIRU